RLFAILLIVGEADVPQFRCLGPEGHGATCQLAVDVHIVLLGRDIHHKPDYICTARLQLDNGVPRAVMIVKSTFTVGERSCGLRNSRDVFVVAHTEVEAALIPSGKEGKTRFERPSLSRKL